MMRQIGFLILAAVLAGCAPQSRHGMVVDLETGLQMGSQIENNIVVDSSQFENRRLKLNIRNTSGDPAFDLRGFRSELERAYAAKGYAPTQDEDFGVLVDVNVRYSGQATRDRAAEFGLLGGAAGGLVGYEASRRAVGAGAGILTGATLGAVIGSHARDETYLVVAEVVVGVSDPARGTVTKTIIMDSSPTPRDETKRRTGLKPFSQSLKTGIAVYAGGFNVSQSRIADGVRQRFVRILSDVI